jgi:hypothetical protein
MGAMAELVWRAKPVAELGSGIVSETEVVRIERDDFTVSETVGLTLDEGQQLTAAIQAEIVRAQVTGPGWRRIILGRSVSGSELMTFQRY